MPANAPLRRTMQCRGALQFGVSIKKEVWCVCTIVNGLSPRRYCLDGNILTLQPALRSMHTMRVIQVVQGAFHHFDLARELEARGHLQRIYSGFPWRRLQREGVPRNHVATFPWVHTSLFMIERYWRMPRKMRAYLDYQDTLLFDSWVASRIENCDVLVGLSGAALKTGQLAQSRGGKYVCDRGSSHIRYQERLVSEEYRRWGVRAPVCDERIVRARRSGICRRRRHHCAFGVRPALLHRNGRAR